MAEQKLLQIGEMELLEALKLMDDYRFLLTDANPDIYDEMEIHFIVKDCALLAVNKIINAHAIDRDADKLVFWTNVKEQLNLL